LILWGVLNNEKALPYYRMASAFFVVDKRFELSNQLTDIIEINKMFDILDDDL